MKLTILSGTNRPGSTTRKVAAQLAGIYTVIGQPADILDLAELPPEIFDVSSYVEKPASFRRFSDAVLASDGIHIVTPEYNGGPPGVLKYFIDMLKFPESFERRPVAFTGLSSGIWGAMRAGRAAPGNFQLSQCAHLSNAGFSARNSAAPGAGRTDYGSGAVDAIARASGGFCEVRGHTEAVRVGLRE